MRVARLGDVVASMKNGIYKPASEYAADGVPCLRMYNIEGGAIAWRDIKRMRLTSQEQEDYGLREGDLLVNRVNSRELVGKSAYVPASIEQSVFESKNIRVRLARDRVEPKFINYQLLARGSQHFANNAQQVVGMASISQGQLADFPIALAGLPEQRRIVAEIETQFSRLDEAVTGLRRVKANLNRHRASVLSTAIAGRLLPHSVRRSGVENPVEETGSAIPRGWAVAAVADLCESIVDCPHSTARFQSEGVPCIDTTWMSPDGLVWERARFVDVATYAQRTMRLPPRAGDIVFAREGTIGTAIIIPEGMTSCLGQRVMLLRTNRTISPRYLLHALQSDVVRAQYRDISLGSTVAHINVRDVKKLAIPLPPLEEQHRIVAEVDRRLSIVRGVEAQVEANLKRAQSLRQAVLNKAFAIPSESHPNPEPGKKPR